MLRHLKWTKDRVCRWAFEADSSRSAAVDVQATFPIAAAPGPEWSDSGSEQAILSLSDLYFREINS